MSSVSSKLHYIMLISMGSISSCASFLIILSIILSTDKLKTPYRRIIFSISISDLLLSLGIVTGPFASPVDTPSALWATGNTQTCEANGFVFLAGQLGVYFYTAMLGIYYYCKLNKKMNNATFTKIEKVLHIFMILFMLAILLIALIMGSFNSFPPRGSFCHLVAFPYGCRQNPEKLGECKRGDNVPLILVFFGQQFVCLIIVIITMLLVGRNAVIIKRNFQSTRPSDVPEGKKSVFSTLYNVLTCIPCQFRDQQEYETDADVVLRRYARETLIQAFLYCGAFLLTFFITSLTLIINTFRGGNISQGGSDAFAIIRVILFPLGGLFNILIYTRPNVGKLRDSHPDLSWLMAFLLVLSTGNEIPILTSEDSGLRKLLCCKKSLSTIIAHTSVDEHPGSTDLISAWNDISELGSGKYRNSDSLEDSVLDARVRSISTIYDSKSTSPIKEEPDRKLETPKGDKNCTSDQLNNPIADSSFCSISVNDSKSSSLTKKESDGDLKRFQDEKYSISGFISSTDDDFTHTDEIVTTKIKHKDDGQICNDILDKNTNSDLRDGLSFGPSVSSVPMSFSSTGLSLDPEDNVSASDLSESK